MVEVGLVTWYNYTGEVFRRSPTGSGGPSDRGWAYYDGATGTTSGQDGEAGGGSAAQSVVDRFLSTGACTVGWEVWVDGDQRCKADGS
ncbi:MAG: hypothetical protein ABJE10_16840 [bacterium]